MKKRILTTLLLISALALSACGKKDAGVQEEDIAQEAEETSEAADTGEAASDENALPSEDVGKYVIYEYEANGNKVSHDMLEQAGMGDTYLELKEDGTGKLKLFDSELDITWKSGVVTVYGTSEYTYTIDGDTLNLDMQGVYYTMIREGGSAAASTEETDSSDQDGGEASESTSGEAPNGDGLIDEEAVLKGYVWLNDIKGGQAFDLTYDDLKAYFGCDGKFDKEEYSDHMQCNYRYYSWISKDHDNVFIYINLAEKDGVYKVSSFNSSGFSATEAKDKYLDELKAEAGDEAKAAAAAAGSKSDTFTVSKFSSEDDNLEIGIEYPAAGWSADASFGKVKLYATDDLSDTFDVPFIKFELKDKVEDFDFYKDDFENFKEIGTRTIGGIEMTGRSYKSIGYDWIEYVGKVADGKAISIGTVDVDLSDGSVGSDILDSISFK